MAVVLKSNNGGGKKSPVSAWLGYGAVAVFGLAIVATAFMGGGKEPDPMDSAYSYSDFKDLADMPFSNEEAEAELLSSVRYGDIAKNDLINALFTEEDKEARKAEDAANGLPEPPDAEYAEAAKAKEKVRTAKEKYYRSKAAAKAAVAQRTSKGALSSSGGVKVGSASSGVSTTIWRADDKKNSKTSASAAASGSLSGQLAKDVKNINNRGGFMAAYEKSRAAANASNLEDAHALAADAFQNGGDLEADLNSELEKNAEGLDINKMMGELDKDKLARAASNLDDGLDKAKKEADNKDKNKKDYKCDGGSMNGKIDAGCMMNELFGVMMDLGKQALTSLLSNKGKGELSADELQQRNLMKENYNSQIEALSKKDNLTPAQQRELNFYRATLETMNAKPNASVGDIIGSDSFKSEFNEIQTQKNMEKMRRDADELSKKLRNQNLNNLFQLRPIDNL